MGTSKRRVLLITSYCGEEDTNCTNEAPCINCLKMCNIVDMEGIITEEYGGYDYNYDKTYNKKGE